VSALDNKMLDSGQHENNTVSNKGIEQATKDRKGTTALLICYKNFTLLSLLYHEPGSIPTF
jgi:hypothetical protein